MTQIPSHTPAAVTKSVAAWHLVVARRDLSNLAAIVHPDAVFRSPMAINAYAPAEALILATVLEVFENFTYHRQLATHDGLSVALEFSARVGDRDLKVSISSASTTKGWSSSSRS